MLRLAYLILPILFLLGCRKADFERPPHSPISDMSDAELHEDVQRVDYAVLKEVRHNPNTAHISDTSDKVRRICNSQHGGFRYNEGADLAECWVGEFPIFRTLFEDDVVVGVDTYYEDREVSSLVEKLIPELGEPRIDAAQRRTYEWIRGNYIIQVSSYDRGAFLRIAFVGDRRFPFSENDFEFGENDTATAVSNP